MEERGASPVGEARRFLLDLPFRDKAVVVGSLIAFGMFFLDPLVVHWVRQLDPNVRHIFWTITDVGKSGWVLILTGTAFIACVGFAYRANHKRLRVGRVYAGQLAAFVFLSVASTGIVASLLKGLIGRARPKHFEQLGSFDFTPFAFQADLASFPSGHATTTFALATAIAVVWPRIAVPVFTAAVWIAASRFLTGAHYVSDVVAGGLLGTLGTLGIRRMLCARRSLFKEGCNGPCLRSQRIALWLRPNIQTGAGWALKPSEWIERLAPEKTPLDAPSLPSTGDTGDGRSFGSLMARPMPQSEEPRCPNRPDQKDGERSRNERGALGQRSGSRRQADSLTEMHAP